MPLLESNLTELNHVVEKCSKEIEREITKKQIAINENNELREKLQQF